MAYINGKKYTTRVIYDYFDVLEAIENNTLTEYSSNITKLNDLVFYNCISLKRLDLPNATSLGNSAFKSCTGLQEVNLASASTMGTYCFSGCTSLETVKFGIISALGGLCFENCSNLKDLWLGYAGVVSIPSAAVFKNVTGCTVHVRPEYASQYASATNWTSLIENGQVTIVGDYYD